MTARSLIVTLALLAAGLVGPGLGTAHADVGGADRTVRSCTKTSTGKCIRGGQFCPRASYGRAGYDAKGRRYVCKGNRKHPHWMR